jgi:hypothetical protein
VREVREALLIARSDRDRAFSDQLRSFELSQTYYDPFQRLAAFAGTAAAYAEYGELDEARRYAVEVPPMVRDVGIHGALTRLAPFADELSIREELRDALALAGGPEIPVWRRTIELGLTGDLAGAADVMGEAGNPTIEANLRRHAGLLTGGADQLERALAFYRTVDASFYIEQIERALAGAQSESA